jgi:hypothetical protein
MSDEAAAGAPEALEPSPAASCANCGAELRGRFCSQCGQEAKPLDPPVRHFARELAQELLDVDGRVPRSFRRLFFSPGYLTREYVAGRRVPWLTPLRMYLIASVAWFGVQAMIGDPGGVHLTFTGAPEEIQQKVRWFGFESEAQLRAAVDTARYTWMPRVMFVLVPCFAWLVALVRRGACRRFPAHFVFALEVHAAVFVMLAIVRGLASFTSPQVGRTLDALGDLYILGYIFLAFRTAYGGTRWKAARDTVFVSMVYTMALMTATGVVVAFAMFGRRWLQALGF